MTTQQINDMFTAMEGELSPATREQLGWWRTTLWSLVDNVAEHIHTSDIMKKRGTEFNSKKMSKDAKKTQGFC